MRTRARTLLALCCASSFAAGSSAVCQAPAEPPPAWKARSALPFEVAPGGAAAASTPPAGSTGAKSARGPSAAPVAEPPIELAEVLSSVRSHFPLLFAVEQETAIAAGNRLAAEGQFDLMLRARGSEQGGTFSNGRLDFGLEQPIASNGASTFAGWRLGQGNFPIYYGDRKTADGGEFRAGVTIPLMQNRAIDGRRARLAAAQISERLADPQIRRARLDYFRGAAWAYWTWVAAGTQYQVAEDLLRLARDRQSLIDAQRREQLVAESVQALNRRLAAGREEQLIAADRAVQQSAIRLSLYLRDLDGNPTVPTSSRIPAGFISTTPAAPVPERLDADVEAAIARRPELARFALQRSRASLDLRLAENQQMPIVNAFAAVAQDAGSAKKTFIGEGPFSTDRTAAEAGLTFELPAQRRDARGRAAAARAQIAQINAQERYARDEVAAQVADALSELLRTYSRLDRARVELREARRVRELEEESFRAGRTSLVDLNLQEVAAAEAQVKVIAVLAAYFRGVADYQAAVGDEPAASAAPPQR